MKRLLGRCHSSQVAFLLAVIPPLSVRGAPGLIDPDFGTAGLVVMAPASGPGAATAVTVQATDGGIVVAGDTTQGNGDMAVMRFLSGGALDPNFGNAGLVTASVGLFDSVGGMAVQSDRKIVIAGCGVVNGGTRDIAVMRLLANGSPDPDFGNGGLQVVTPADPYNESISCLALESNGSILAAGGGKKGFVVARFSAQGEPDPTLGGQGISELEVFRPGANAFAMALQPDGKIILGGDYRTLAQTEGPVMVRLWPDGSIDGSFGADGAVSFTDTATCRAVSVRGDGRILMAGSIAGDFFITQHMPDGTLDPTFGFAGVVTLNTGGIDTVQTMAVANNGKIVVAGTSTQAGRKNAVILRLRANGILDTGFGTGGATYPAFGDEDTINALALQSDGRAVAVGGSRLTGGTPRFAIARFLADDSLHPIESWRITHFGSPANSGLAADAADADGDGVVNFLEYSFGLDPRNRASRALPEPIIQGGALTLTVPTLDSAKGVTVSVQASPSLATPAWQLLTGVPGPTGTTFTAPSGVGQAFMRVRVDLTP